MSWWAVLRADLSRRPLRMFLTVLSLVLAFVLFGLLQPVRVMFNEGVDLGDDARLIVGPKHSVADLLPVAHAQRIENLEGVEDVTYVTWFGGTYIDPANFFPQFAVTADAFLRINRELELPAEHAAAFLRERRGAIAGVDTAARFGWQVGDRIALTPNIWHNRDGEAWHFDLVGVFRSTNEALLGNDGFYFGYGYFDEYRAFGNGTAGSFVVQAANPRLLSQTAQRIDAEFANSRDETRTQTSAQYALGMARQLGEIGQIATLVLAAVFFTLVMVTGHTMAHSVRERVSELAVMRVLGFSSVRLAAFLIVQSLVVTVCAGLIGLGLAVGIAQGLDTLLPQVKQLGGLTVNRGVVLQGAALAAAVGAGVTAWPVARAVRQGITESLRVEG